MLKYAIFDLDGTVLDSMGIWQNIDAEFLKKHSLGDSEKYFEETRGMNFMQFALYTIEKYHMDRTPESLMKEWDEMARKEYETTVQAKPGAVKFIKKLHGMGVKLAVATSNYEAMYKPALVRLGIYDLFDTFCETHNSLEGKSNPKIYLEAVKNLGGTPEACAVFEDIIIGIRSANSAGFTTFAVADKHSKADEPFLRKEAFRFTYDYSDIDISLFERNTDFK